MTTRVGVVGAGWWSSAVHLPTITADRSAELVIICDADGDRARAAAELFGAPRWTTRVADLVDAGVECAVVATPHDAHYGPAAVLLDAGVDVLIEKPMVIEPAHAWDLVARAERNGARLHVGYPFLHSVQADRLRQVVADGEIGTTVLADAVFATAVEGFYRGDMSAQRGSGAPFGSRPDTYSSAARGGGQLLTQATHALSLLLWTLREDIASVQAFLAAGPDQEVDRTDVVLARTRSDALLSLASTGTVPDNDERVEQYKVFGTSGHVLLDTVLSTVVLHRGGRAPQLLSDAGDGDANAVAAPVAALISSRQQGTPPTVDGVLGAQVAEVTWAARVSTLEGRGIQPGRWREATTPEEHL